MNQLIRHLHTSDVKKNLIVFPFAGGYSTSFYPLFRNANTDWNIWAIDTPNVVQREFSFMMDDLLDKYEELIMKKFDPPFVFLGHSMGGMIAYLLSRRLEKKEKLPSAVILSATMPPNVVRETRSELPDGELLTLLAKLNDIPDDKRDLLKYFLPKFRSDLRILESTTEVTPYKIKTPAFILGGKCDSKCTPQQLCHWSEWVDVLNFFLFDGGHMFLLKHPEEASSVILAILKEVDNHRQKLEHILDGNSRWDYH